MNNQFNKKKSFFSLDTFLSPKTSIKKQITYVNNKKNLFRFSQKAILIYYKFTKDFYKNIK